VKEGLSKVFPSLGTEKALFASLKGIAVLMDFYGLIQRTDYN
jgi:hypothetical protein